MNELVFKGQNDQVVTTSLKVAEVFEKQHKDVLESIRELIKGSADFSANPMFDETIYTHPQNGQQYPMFIMNRDGFTLLAMGFNGKKALQFKIEYIKAFNKMEAELKGKFQVPTTFAEALRLAAEQQEKIEEQQKLIEVQTPKAEFYDEVVDSKDAIDMQAVAKVINMGIGRNKLFDFLRNNKVLMQNNQPYQYYIDLGWFRVIESKYTKPSGDICINLKTVVFQKGVDGIRKLIKQNKHKNNK